MSGRGVLLVALGISRGGEEAKEQGYAPQRGVMWPKVGYCRAFEVDRAHDFDEVAGLFNKEFFSMTFPVSICCALYHCQRASNKIKLC